MNKHILPSLMIATPLIVSGPRPALTQPSAPPSFGGAWETYSATAPFTVCGMRGPAGSGLLSMEVRGDAPHALRLRLSDPGRPMTAPGALSLHASFTGLTSGSGGLVLAGTAAGQDIEVDMRGDDVRSWMHGFTGGNSATITVTGPAPTVWTLDLGGTTAAVNAMQACILAIGLTDVPAPFVTAPAGAPPSARESEAVPAGYAIVETVQIGPGGVSGKLQVLEDQRLTPDLRASMWERSGDLAMVLDATDPRMADFTRHPMLPARLRLLAPNGQVAAEQVGTVPLAKVEAVPMHHLATPTFVYTEDFSTGAGSYSGPFTELLQPTATGLKPVVAESADGARSPISLARTLKAGWRIARLRDGTDGIHSVRCDPDFEKQKRPSDAMPFVVSYTTYRYAGGWWQARTRKEPGFWENEVFPDPSLFP